MILRRNSKTTTSQKESNLNIYANPYDYDDVFILFFIVFSFSKKKFIILYQHSDEFSSKPFYYENKNQNNDLKTFSNKSKFHKKQVIYSIF